MGSIEFQKLGGGELYDDGVCAVRELIDNETGVHYLVFADAYHKGVSMTPRLCSDGSVMTDKK